MTDLEDALDGVDSREVTQVAALDIGSNSFHLVVARIMAGSLQILHRVKQKVRLADGLDDEGMLSKEAIARGLAALEECKESMLGFKPEKVRIVATYTLRKAINSGEFISAARKVLPYPVEVISGVEEARLIYQGVAHTSSSSGSRLVVDIGGGSTEFIVGEGFDPLLMRSLSMGCVNFTQRYFPEGELKEKAFQKAITAAHQELELISDKYRAMGWDICIGTSGTIKTLANVCAELEGKPEAGKITHDNLKQLIKHCCDVGKDSKLGFSAITEDRVPVFAAGLAVLKAVFESLDINEMEYSSAALREGVLYEMEDRLLHHDIRQRTAESIATRYDVDTNQARRVLHTTSNLLQQVKEEWQLDDPELQNILGWSALLHEVGLQINSRRVQHHSAYILTHADLPGFNQEQQTLLSTLVACHRKKFSVDSIPRFEQFEKHQVLRLISLLRIAALLNIKRQDNLLPEITASVSKDGLCLAFADGWLENKPLIVADLEVEANRQDALGIKLNFC